MKPKEEGIHPRTKGFTLIELMVVVLIIGLIASGVLINVNKSRKQARDAKRISDINTGASALAAYYADKHAYPITNEISKLVSEGYIQSMPQDPLSPESGWVYTYSSSGSPPNTYNLWSKMELNTGEGVITCGSVYRYQLKDGENYLTCF